MLGNQLRKLIDATRSVDIEVNEIVCETDTGILVEWQQINAWLPKSRIKIEECEGILKVTVPRSIYKTKFC